MALMVFVDNPGSLAHQQLNVRGEATYEARYGEVLPAVFKTTTNKHNVSLGQPLVKPPTNALHKHQQRRKW